MYDLKRFEGWQNLLAEQNAANEHLLRTLGITIDNLDEHEIYVDNKGEIIKVLRVMKATIWEKTKC